MGELHRYEVEVSPGTFTTLKLTAAEAETMGGRPLEAEVVVELDEAPADEVKARRPANKARIAPNKNRSA